jgi:hypothetical protein
VKPSRRPPQRDHIVRYERRSVGVYLVVREAVRAGDDRPPEALNAIASAALVLLALLMRVKA